MKESKNVSIFAKKELMRRVRLLVLSFDHQEGH